MGAPDLKEISKNCKTARESIKGFTAAGTKEKQEAEGAAIENCCKYKPGTKIHLGMCPEKQPNGPKLKRGEKQKCCKRNNKAYAYNFGENEERLFQCKAE